MSDGNQIQEHPYGWVIVAVATTCLTLAFGANLTVSVLVDPFEREFGWSRADISMAYTMATVGAAVGGILWGALSDRIGAKKIAFLGGISLAVTMILLSYQSSLQNIYVLFMIMGFLGFGCLFTPLLALTGLWFSRRKGLALGIVTAGGAIGQGVIPFLERFMISSWGWREAIFYVGCSYLVILMPLLFLLKPPPVLATGDINTGKSDDNLWGISHMISIPWLTMAALFCCICMAAPLIHLLPLGMDIGLDPETAASLLFALMASGVIGRLVFGSLADRIGGLHAYFLASLGQTIMVFWFTQTQSLIALYGFSILFGFAFAGVMTCLVICAREAAPLRLVGLASATVAGMGWVGMGTGGFQAGYFFDLNGTYNQSFGNAAFAGIINLAILAALIWYQKRKRSILVPA
jgi:MFS family permease